MTKLIHLALAALLCCGLTACKKDFPLDLVEVVEQPPFYVNGSYHSTRDAEKQSFAWDMQPNDYDVVETGVASATGSVNGHKYIAAVMSYDPRMWQAKAPFVETASPFSGVYNSMVGVKIVSSLPADEVSQPFTKAELEALLRPGEYQFGNGPLQVEVGTRRPTGDLLMMDLVPQWSEADNYFEILAVEDYRIGGAQAVQGKAVDFRCRATLRYPYLISENLTYFLEMEGKLLFEYKAE
jgi:hypothetical protein